ncbi:hypothetical protein [Pseudochrobactrum saccharolyticum]|uniref:hypothetical protein n=1 Tax=Pseudochrobactrum saccharolyticum TaxID=354352 RepID=UPI00275D2DFD|nr:hypothetical protein [Pseudochrobactrum saccharolyticum]MDP8249953.1 hypothetical protein [Pseudochrobactrum saccharolyticum]
MKHRQLVSSDEAIDGKVQHKKPCSDCPWARTALNGWLGSASPDEWLRNAHSDTMVDCHTIRNTQCAGLAIYRRNVCKSVLPPLLKLEANKEIVFATPMEFKEHHSRMPEGRAALAQGCGSE